MTRCSQMSRSAPIQGAAGSTVMLALQSLQFSPMLCLSQYNCSTKLIVGRKNQQLRKVNKGCIFRTSYHRRFFVFGGARGVLKNIDHGSTAQCWILAGILFMETSQETHRQSQSSSLFSISNSSDPLTLSSLPLTSLAINGPHENPALSIP